MLYLVIKFLFSEAYKRAHSYIITEPTGDAIKLSQQKVTKNQHARRVLTVGFHLAAENKKKKGRGATQAEKLQAGVWRKPKRKLG